MDRRSQHIRIHNIASSYDISVTIYVTIYFLVTNRTYILVQFQVGHASQSSFYITFLVPVKEENVFPYIKYMRGKTHHELLIIRAGTEVVISGGR